MSSIERADLNGGHRTLLFAPVSGVPGQEPGLALGGDDLYFGPREADIGRIELSGANAMPDWLTVLQAGQSIPSYADETWGSALTVGDGYIFWASAHYAIGRASLTGGEVNTDLNPIPGLAVALAVVKRRLYWATDSKIGSERIDGSDVATNLLKVQLETVDGLAVAGQYLYWTDWHSIGRAKLDGTDADPNFISERGYPYSPVVVGRYIYWRAIGTGSSWIRRALLSGRGMQDVLSVNENPAGTFTADSRGPQPVAPPPARQRHRRR